MSSQLAVSHRPQRRFIAELPNGTPLMGFNTNRLKPVPFTSGVIYRGVGVGGQISRVM